MLLKGKMLFMFRYVVAVLLFSLFISCEEETPTSEFVPDSFLRNTKDKIIAQVDGENFFFDINPTAAIANDPLLGGSSLQIRFNSRDKGDIVLIVPSFIEEDKIYTINAEMPENRFTADYVDANDNRYRAAFSSSGNIISNEGTLNITVDAANRTVTGTFSFSALLDTSSGGVVREDIEVTDGVINAIPY